MGNIIRAEVSEKNPYWIEKHRHYELKHFCLQYPIWKKAYSSNRDFVNGYERTILLDFNVDGNIYDLM